MKHCQKAETSRRGFIVSNCMFIIHTSSQLLLSYHTSVSCQPYFLFIFKKDIIQSGEFQQLFLHQQVIENITLIQRY